MCIKKGVCVFEIYILAVPRGSAFKKVRQFQTKPVFREYCCLDSGVKMLAEHDGGFTKY